MAAKTSRDDELSARPKIRDRLLELFRDVEQGFADQRQRSDDILDYWDAYNCQLGERQFYSGNSKIYVPIIRNAVEARKTRFVNQMFPQTGRYVEVTTGEEDIPHATMALIEHYISEAKLRTQVMPALMINGDIEGQMTVYVDWSSTTRHTVRKETRPVEVGGLEMEELGEVEHIIEEEIEDARPSVEVIADADFLVLPVTVDSLEQALEVGGSITIVRRWTKAKVRKMIAEGEFVKSVGDALIKAMSKKDNPNRPDTKKELADAAGIRTSGSGKFCVGYETWTKVKVDGDMRLCRAYYGGEDQILGCKLNPYWCDRQPVISAPVRKIPGVFKGQSMIQAGVLDMQIAANDAVNEGMDSAAYALMPIIMTNPESNPRVGSMVLDLAAVWEVNPNDTKFAQFPQLWKEAFEIVSASKTEIFQSLGVNPAMMPQQTGGRGKKMSQAEIANEQQVDILTTADAVTNVEGEILTPMVQRYAEYDSQFRDDEIMVRQFGEMGMRAQMEEVPPLQMNKRFTLRWFGVEAARNAAQIQQQIAGLNVIRGIPEQMYPGYKLNAAPLLVHLVEQTFGPRIAPLIFQSAKDQLTVDPETENDLLAQGFPVHVHVGDDDPSHLQAHMAALADGDPSGNIRTHIQAHQQQMQGKQQAAMMAAAQQQQGQQPGGGGGPRPGGQPANPRQNKGPPGMIHPDQMGRAGAVVQPRKM